MKRLAIIGSSDLAVLIAHHAVETTQFRIAGFFDNKKEIGTVVENFGEVIGSSDDIEIQFQKNVFDELIVGVGYTQMKFRKESFLRFSDKIPMATIIHNSAYVDPSCEIGKGVVVLPGSILDHSVKLEDNVLLNTGVSISHHSIVNAHTFIAPRVAIAGKTKVGASCFVGIGTIIIDHVSICDEVEIGSGSLILKNINEPGRYYGHPAKRIKN